VVQILFNIIASFFNLISVIFLIPGYQIKTTTNYAQRHTTTELKHKVKILTIQFLCVPGTNPIQTITTSDP
jgi:hypothetical protein